ncbi:TetR/AcrR family transcriptional regulator [Desulfosporosinus hippei]|uniref:Transcriptional regulator, TetR family n=1 Tax=Desulfosporosinus hippei DSM 8344 TaxID=1121419 RepID=A0A1G8LCB5_9FIRM|nr:TetR/AcrR family transcriptional regulator [Desulfosporosinus hippei]SDI53256.1 transcriptional regulator, TetR family [Desulfosporosinus hippei DSM 8344]
MDRRIQKTRQLIMNTFLDLLAEKGFEKITISDIAERANINRGTVYLHYVDKFDLLDKCIETYVELLLNHCANSTDTNLSASAFQSVFEYLEKNFTIYKLLLSNEGVGFFRSRLYDIIAQTVTEVIGIKPENNAFSNGITTHFLTSGFIGVLEWWINNSMPCNVQEITEQLMFLLEPYTKRFVSL